MSRPPEEASTNQPVDDERQQLSPELMRILDALYEEHQRSQAPLSLARLFKRTALRMSTLRRLLSALEEAGIAAVVINEYGAGNAILTSAGLALHG